MWACAEDQSDVRFHVAGLGFGAEAIRLTDGFPLPPPPKQPGRRPPMDYPNIPFPWGELYGRNYP